MSKKIIPILQCRQLEDAPLSRWVYRYPDTGETVRLCFGFCAVKTETETIWWIAGWLWMRNCRR